MSELYHFFWNGPFSQWDQQLDTTNVREVGQKIGSTVESVTQFVIDGVEYNCAEQYMMSEKARFFKDNESLTAIMQADHPRTQKAIGRKVKNFDVQEWNEVSREVVYMASWAKFNQSNYYRDNLMSTGDRLLVEASPYDRIWGIGIGVIEAEGTDPEDWNGKNWLGQVITQVREDIRQYEHDNDSIKLCVTGMSLENHDWNNWKRPKSGVVESDVRDLEESKDWTEEDMKDAKPIPMPDPEE